MLLLGLTGSIATGKSTVSSLLAAPPYSLPVIDADALARQVVEPGTRGYRDIVQHFGSTTPDLLLEASESMPEQGPHGRGRPLNRQALGRRVFGDSEECRRDRAVLNGIVHPAVRREMLKAVLRSYSRGAWAAVLDVPLLFESGLDRFCGATMVVAVSDPAVQMRRLRERDAHLSAEEAEDRVRSQADVRDKARRSAACGGTVLWNDGDREDLRAQLQVRMEELRARSPGWWHWLLLGCPPLALVVAALAVWRNGRASRRWEEDETRRRAKL